MQRAKTIIVLAVLAFGVTLAKNGHSWKEYDNRDNSVISQSDEEDEYSNDDSFKMTAFPMEISTSQSCGTDVTSDNRIVGGEPTQLYQYPWLAAIEFKMIKNGNVDWFCGGSLISGRYVLTAAHCFKPKTRVPINVILGDYNIHRDGPDCVDYDDQEICTDGELRIKIKEAIIHPHYHPSLSHHDIALVRLSKMAPYTVAIRPICLPSQDLNLHYHKKLWFYSAGWGYTEESDNNMESPVKKHVSLPFVDFKKCKSMWTSHKEKVIRSQICAGGVKNQDTCTGDSGGPLMYNNGGRFELTGVVNYGLGCGRKKVPGVYANVFRYKKWIMDEITSREGKFKL